MTTCMSTGRGWRCILDCRHKLPRCVIAASPHRWGGFAKAIYWCLLLHLRLYFAFTAQARCSATGDSQVSAQGRLIERGETFDAFFALIACLTRELDITMG